MRRVLSVLFACALLLTASAARADEARGSATVSFLEGSSTFQTGGEGKAKALKKDAEVFENDTVTTGAQGRVELKMKDGSIVRIGPASKLQLRSAHFVANESKRFNFKLLFGKVWSKVNGLVGNNAKFEVETDNAVAGVRGTTFRVDANKDKSVLVRVYAGAVATRSPELVTPGHKIPDKREQVQGPKTILKAEWEKLVGAQMQLQISAKGVPAEPKAFTAADDDAWAKWNQKRDAE